MEGTTSICIFIISDIPHPVIPAILFRWFKTTYLNLFHQAHTHLTIHSFAPYTVKGIPSIIHIHHHPSSAGVSHLTSQLLHSGDKASFYISALHSYDISQSVCLLCPIVIFSAVGTWFLPFFVVLSTVTTLNTQQPVSHSVSCPTSLWYASLIHRLHSPDHLGTVRRLHFEQK